MSNSEKLLLKGIRIGIVAALFSPLILGQFGLDFAEYPKAVFWVLISTVKEKEDWLQILNLTVLISGIPSLAGILQKLGLASFYGTDLPERISGTFSNPDLFGSYLVLNIFLGLFLLTIENGKKRAGGKAALIAITVLNFFTLFLSGQRGAWVGAAAGLIFFEFFWLLRYSRPHRRFKIIVLSLSFAFGF